MTHEEFYQKLISTEEPLVGLYEQLTDKSYPELVDFLDVRFSKDFSFFPPDQRPNAEKDKPMITVLVRERFGIVIMIFTLKVPFNQGIVDRNRAYLISVRETEAEMEEELKRAVDEQKKKNGDPAHV